MPNHESVLLGRAVFVAEETSTCSNTLFVNLGRCGYDAGRIELYGQLNVPDGQFALLHIGFQRIVVLLS